MSKFGKNVTTRKLRATDKQDFLNLQLKHGDVLELYNMLEITAEEYLEWHYEAHRTRTTGLFYQGKLFGFMCITEEGTLCFLTEDLNSELKRSMVRYFKVVLLEEMDKRNVDKVTVWMDSVYTKSLAWALRGGFVEEETVDGFLTDFKVLAYYRQNVAN